MWGDQTVPDSDQERDNVRSRNRVEHCCERKTQRTKSQRNSHHRFAPNPLGKTP
jgi:hypothetical protein